MILPSLNHGHFTFDYIRDDVGCSDIDFFWYSFDLSEENHGQFSKGSECVLNWACTKSFKKYDKHLKYTNLIQSIMSSWTWLWHIMVRLLVFFLDYSNAMFMLNSDIMLFFDLHIISIARHENTNQQHFIRVTHFVMMLILISSTPSRIAEWHDTYQKTELRPVVNKVPIGVYRVGLR